MSAAAKALITVAVVLLMQEGAALTVYDCLDRNATTAKIDLVHPGDCSAPSKVYMPKHPTRILVAQANSARPVTVARCFVQETRRAERCGFDSITYGTLDLMWMKTIPVDPEECWQGVFHGEMRYKDRTYLTDGTRHTHIYDSHGGVDSFGNCWTERFTFEGRTLVGFYEKTVRTFVAEEITGLYEPGTGKIHLKGGLVAEMKDLTLQDHHLGTFVWRKGHATCSRTHARVYQGQGHIRNLRHKLRHRHEGALVLFSDDRRKQAAGFRLGDKTSLCGRGCYTTQVQDMVVCLLGELENTPVMPEVEYDADRMASSLRGQIAFLHLSAQLRNQEAFQTIEAELCRQDRELLDLRLKTLADRKSVV